MIVLISIFSPTWLLASFLKNHWQRDRVIKAFNWTYLCVSLGSVVVLAFHGGRRMSMFDSALTTVLTYFLFSRCNEIFYAFLKDAMDHLNHIPPFSLLTYGDRLSLALRSYLELISNFGILFFLCPLDYWRSAPPASVVESLYFSGVTITTTGYGDITPKHWLPQFLAIYEVFCGVILLVVCFTIYTSRGMQRTSNSRKPLRFKRLSFKTAARANSCTCGGE